MDIQSLEAFLAVAENASFSRAAEQLFLTQPAVSKRIANLESSFGTPLFDRVGRGIYLTEAGKVLQERARAIVDDMKDTHTSMANLSTNKAKQLSMASSHHIGLHYLGPILKQFVNENPQADIALEFMESEQAIRALLNRDIEIALTTLPSRLDTQLSATTLWQDELIFVVAPDHPLAQRSQAIRLNELAHMTAILPDKNTTTFEVIEQTFLRHHIPLKRTLNVNYLETIRALVANNLGWSLLPATLIDDSIATLNVERVELTRRLGLIHHKQRSLSRGAERFMAIASQFEPAK